MNTKITIALSLVAGFVGGAMFHYICSPLAVQAHRPDHLLFPLTPATA